MDWSLAGLKASLAGFFDGLFPMLLKVLSHLFKGLKDAAAGIVGKVLSTFGLTMVSFNSVLPQLKSFLAAQVAGLPGWAINLISALGIDVAMTIVISALSVRMAWKVWIIPKSVANQLGAGS